MEFLYSYLEEMFTTPLWFIHFLALATVRTIILHDPNRPIARLIKNNWDTKQGVLKSLLVFLVMYFTVWLWVIGLFLTGIFLLVKEFILWWMNLPDTKKQTDGK